MSSVDVIVPCYRYGHFLQECVQSVLTQSIENIRILIIDDASPDNTADVAADLVRNDKRVTCFRHAVNKGHISTYNEGIEWATADYMLILSADDYLLPGALSRSADLMDAHPEVGITFGRVVVLEDGRPRKGFPLLNVTDESDRRIFKGLRFIELSGSHDIVATPTAVVRTELQKRLGGYRPELPHSGDMEMWLRVAAHASVGILGAYQAVYRRHTGNMSLSYTAKTWLPDLQQRKAAFEIFFQTCSQAIPGPYRLHRKLLRLLACDAIGFASSAFNEGEMDLAKQLVEFALGICPQIKMSQPWIKFTGKRLVGFEGWRALQPVIRTMRRRMKGIKVVDRLDIREHTFRLVNGGSSAAQDDRSHIEYRGSSGG